ncbi:hypothetical protein CsatA_022233 [Cannabis sativa]
MSNSIESIVKNNNTGPKSILKEAFAANAKAEIQGSSTACILCHNNGILLSTACILCHNNGILQSVNVGDSGFIIFRNDKLVYRSKTQLVEFNVPYQLGNSEGYDTPDSAGTMEITVVPKDVIVLETDGLFDNMFVSDIEDVF